MQNKWQIDDPLTDCGEERSRFEQRQKHRTLTECICRYYLVWVFFILFRIRLAWLFDPIEGIGVQWEAKRQGQPAVQPASHPSESIANWWILWRPLLLPLVERSHAFSCHCLVITRSVSTTSHQRSITTDEYQATNQISSKTKQKMYKKIQQQST